MDARAVLAAGSNAEWCDLVCRTHGVDTWFNQDVWVALRRSPPMYPDAVTLSERLQAGAVLGRVDDSAGCSIKDSFASVDLSAEGFHPLFDAEWIHRPPGDPWAEGALRWSVVRTADQLLAWSAAHGGGDVFRPALLADSDVAVVAALDGDVLVAGAIGHRGASAVGVSNVLTTTADTDHAWAGAVSMLCAQFPGLPLVGYESGSYLLAAHRVGFVSVGPLRVWLKD